MMPSYGRTPEWFATISAGPASGTFWTPWLSTRHHTVYRNSNSGWIVSVNLRS